MIPEEYKSWYQNLILFEKSLLFDFTQGKKHAQSKVKVLKQQRRPITYKVNN